MKTNLFKKTMAFLLMLTLVLPLFTGIKVSAAEKPTLNTSKMDIAIGSYHADMCCDFSEEYGKYTISVENSVEEATYTFTSKNKKIASVKGNGTTGYITGKKAGKTTITVKQTLKGKTTTVGTCKVVVKKTTLNDKNKTISDFYLGKDQGLPPGTLSISYYNPNAKYTFICKDNNFQMEEGIYTEEGWDFSTHYINYTAKKPGTYKVTIKETYKGKTRSLGSFNALVNAPTVQTEKIMFTDGKIYASSLLRDAESIGYWISGDGFMVEELTDDSIVYLYEEEGSYYLKAIKPGTATINFSYDTPEHTKGDLIGSCTITVKTLDEVDVTVDETFELSLADGGWGSIYYDTTPEEFAYDANKNAESSDPSVVEVQWASPTCIDFTALKEGTATITLTVGHIIKEIKVTVTE